MGIARALIAITAVASATALAAGSTKEDYELQERCGKLALQVFERDFGGGISKAKDGASINAFSAHYDNRSNRCFVLYTSTTVTRTKEKGGLWTLITLFDLNDNREYGTFLQSGDDAPPFTCTVSGRQCRSKAEWDELVKPYMDE